MSAAPESLKKQNDDSNQKFQRRSIKLFNISLIIQRLNLK